MNKTIQFLLVLSCSILPLNAVESVRWAQGHGDITVDYVNDTWRFGASIEGFAQAEVEPADLVVVLGDDARLAVPPDSDFAFLGEPDAPIWVAPQSAAPGVPFVGLSAEATGSGVFAANRFDLILSGADGPGDFIVWTVDGSGTPRVHMNTRDGISTVDRLQIPAGGHRHVNWGFTSPGTYRLAFKAEGTAANNASELASEEVHYSFQISVLDHGEADIGIAFEDGELELHIHDETSGAESAAEHAALRASAAAWQIVPQDSRFAFLGDAGSRVHVLPQDENESVLFLGLSGEETPHGVFENDQLSLRLLSVDGPGDFFYYETGPFGDPTVFFNSSDGINESDTLPVEAGAHAHRNWVFTSPGVYRVTLQAEGRFLDGGVVAGEPAVFFFEVAEPAFLDRGEVDLEIVYLDGDLDFELLDETQEREYRTSEAVLVLRPAALTVVPENPQFGFLGEPGALVHVLGQNEMEELLFLGIAADEIESGVLAGDELQLDLVSVSGPGEFALYSTESLGAPTVFMNTRDGLTRGDAFAFAVGSHAHVNWAFSAAGLYEVQLKATAASAQGLAIESTPIILRFLVNQADAGPTLTAALVNNGSDIRLSWDSKAGTIYQLQSRESLEAGEWNNQGEPLAGDGGEQSVSAAVQPVALKVFRLVEVRN